MFVIQRKYTLYFFIFAKQTIKIILGKRRYVIWLYGRALCSEAVEGGLLFLGAAGRRGFARFGGLSAGGGGDDDCGAAIVGAHGGDHVGDHLLEFGYEVGGLVFATLYQAELAFPLAGEGGALEERLLDGVDKGDAGGGGGQALALLGDVVAAKKRLDDACAG